MTTTGIDSGYFLNSPVSSTQNTKKFLKTPDPTAVEDSKDSKEMKSLEDFLKIEDYQTNHENFMTQNENVLNKENLKGFNHKKISEFFKAVKDLNFELDFSFDLLVKNSQK